MWFTTSSSALAHVPVGFVALVFPCRMVIITDVDVVSLDGRGDDFGGRTALRPGVASTNDGRDLWGKFHVQSPWRLPGAVRYRGQIQRVNQERVGPTVTGTAS